MRSMVTSMRLSRRALLASGAAALLVRKPARASDGGRYLSAAATLTNNRYAVVAVDEDGQIDFDLDLADRGHGLAVRPGGSEAICFARRPGRFALVIDTLAGAVVTEIPAAPSRHFSGHGLFVQGGDLLLATENDETKHQGVIGIYDARANYARLGEFPTFGIGPHDLALLPDGKTLVVANGGIDKRHDDTGGVEPADIHSDLVYLDWQSQRLLERAVLEPQFARAVDPPPRADRGGRCCRRLAGFRRCAGPRFPAGFPAPARRRATLARRAGRRLGDACAAIAARPRSIAAPASSP